MNKIDRFRGEYAFLSNFYPCTIRVPQWGTLAPSVEHAYQSLKAPNREEALKVLNAKTPGAAKRMGKKFPLPEGWFDNSLTYMEDLVRAKFFKDGACAYGLIATGDAILEEGNEWGDIFWGTVKGEGKNHLGKILMKIRAELTSNP